ncbi:MAG: ABC transporter substrate-binding protein, partial [Candidatus Saccharibacteria bacterium]|nr:ABC transporter substrate-binding protein [Microbacteriaceae bacterium]
MKFEKRRTIVLAIATAVLLTATGCSGGLLGGGGGSSGSTDTGPINIGMVVPISGSSAPTGAYMKNGAQLAVDEINKSGGLLNGRKLKLLVEDEACDAQQAVAAANKLVSSGVV